jgi:hypothetical protein
LTLNPLKRCSEMPSRKRPSAFFVFGAIVLLASASCVFSQSTHAAGAVSGSGRVGSYNNHPLPPSLAGKITKSAYSLWFGTKVTDLLAMDRLRNRPYAKPGAGDLYEQKLEEALAVNALIDPFTGDSLDWSLVGKWSAPPNGDKEKAFDLLPTVDHKDPYSPVLEFEICSWLINRCKSCLTPEEFVALCAKINDHGGSISPPTKLVSPSTVNGQLSTSLKCPVLYTLPPFLKGICMPEKFRKWLGAKAEGLFQRDQRLGRSCAAHGSKASYKKAVYDAVMANGVADPYTGDSLNWAIISTWDPVGKNYDPGTFKEKYSLLPTVDHTNPDNNTLEFEICSWIVNSCKNDMNRDEFLAFCKKVVAYRSQDKTR